MPIYSPMSAELKGRSEFRRMKREVILLRVLLVVGVGFVAFANYVLIQCYI